MRWKRRVQPATFVPEPPTEAQPYRLESVVTQQPRRPIMPSVTEAARRVDMSDAEVSVNEEILAVAEDFAHYVAARSRGITVATPARRRLREEIERVVLAFVRTAEPPSALDKRAEARVLEIVQQAMSGQREEPQDQSLRVRSGEDLPRMRIDGGNVVMVDREDPPPPPPDRMLDRGGL